MQNFWPSLLQQVESIYQLQKTRAKVLPCERIGENYFIHTAPLYSVILQSLAPRIRKPNDSSDIYIL